MEVDVASELCIRLQVAKLFIGRMNSNLISGNRFADYLYPSDVGWSIRNVRHARNE